MLLRIFGSGTFFPIESTERFLETDSTYPYSDKGQVMARFPFEVIIRFFKNPRFFGEALVPAV